jgi:chromosome segregation ATPase
MAIGLLFSAGVAIFGYSIAGRIDKIEVNQQKDEKEIAQRFERKDQRIIAMSGDIRELKQRERDHSFLKAHPEVAERLAVLENNFSSIRIPSLSNVKEQLVNINTRMAAIESDLSGDENKFNDNRESIVAAQAAIKAIEAIVREHEEELDIAEVKIADVQTQVSRQAAQSSAANAEIETQLRGLSAELNKDLAFLHRDIRTLWNEAFDMPLSEVDVYKSDIPAKANTTVGRVNGD